MKATKKIVGAACALVAAVALSAGSTFAWFASSGKASATGMQVKTVVPTNLYIADGAKTAAADFTASSIDYEDATATTLSPVTLVDAAGTLTAKIPDEAKGDAAWTTKPDVGSAGTVAADGYKDIGTVTVSAVTPGTGITLTEYVYSHDMSLLNKAGTDVTEKLKLDIEVLATAPTGTTTINFLKCGFLIGTTWKTMPVGAGAEGLDWTGSGTDYKYTFTEAIELDPNVAQTIRFVVWYEGTDGDCKANNALSVENMNFTINFTKSGTN